MEDKLAKTEVKEVAKKTTPKKTTAKTATKKTVQVKEVIKEVKVENPLNLEMEKQLKELKELMETQSKLIEAMAIEKEEAMAIEKPIEKSNKKHGRLSRDTRVILSTNVDGLFTYSKEFGNTNVYLNFDGYEDEMGISLDELRVFNSGTKFIKNGKITIIDVEDENISVDDVIEDLRLSKLYHNDKSVSPSDIYKMFTDEVDSKEFDKILLNSKNLIDSILEVGLIMKKQGTFNDNAKISLLQQRTKNPALFK